MFVADPGQFPQEDGYPLPPLPGTRREVTASSRRLTGGENVLLTGTEATEAHVRRLAPGAEVLHFATHGIVRDDRPLDSFLALNRGDGAVGDDGQLSSDGMVGLRRAFFYAGTPSAVATLWDVADDPPFRLVSSFYSRLAAAPDKARALRSAQLSMLRALRAGEVKVTTAAGAVALPEHPVLWAGFVLVGEP